MSGGQLAPSGAIPKKRAWVQGCILNASHTELISSQKSPKMVENERPDVDSMCDYSAF
jgi:hypothetical protein